MSKTELPKHLPAPLYTFTRRIIGPAELADFLGVSVSLVYKWTSKATPEAERPPRVAVSQVRFDTWSTEFQAWLDKKLGWEGAGKASAGRAA